MEMNHLDEIVYYLNSLFCPNIGIVYIANKAKAVASLGNQNLHVNQNLA